jgi:hypothetical protein
MIGRVHAGFTINVLPVAPVKIGSAAKARPAAQTVPENLNFTGNLNLKGPTP